MYQQSVHDCSIDAVNFDIYSTSEIGKILLFLCRCVSEFELNKHVDILLVLKADWLSSIFYAFKVGM